MLCKADVSSVDAEGRPDSPVLPDRSDTPNTLVTPNVSSALNTPSSPPTDLRLVEPTFDVHRPMSPPLLVERTIRSEKTNTCTIDSFALVLTTRLDERRTGIEFENADDGGASAGGGPAAAPL